jgi:hypothetical protein
MLRPLQCVTSASPDYKSHKKAGFLAQLPCNELNNSINYKIIIYFKVNGNAKH